MKIKIIRQDNLIKLTCGKRSAVYISNALPIETFLNPFVSMLIGIECDLDSLADVGWELTKIDDNSYSLNKINHGELIRVYNYLDERKTIHLPICNCIGSKFNKNKFKLCKTGMPSYADICNFCINRYNNDKKMCEVFSRLLKRYATSLNQNDILQVALKNYVLLIYKKI